MQNRRNFIQRTALAGGAIMLPWKLGTATARAQMAPAAQMPLAGRTLRQFVDPLPLLAATPGGTMETWVDNGSEILLGMQEFQTHMLPTGTFAPGVKPGTWVWGYRLNAATPAGLADTNIGPVIVPIRGQATQIRFRNNLGDALNSKVIFWRSATDLTLHWADPLGGGANHCAHMSGMPAMGQCMGHYDGPIPVVPHFHGGEVPPVIDGGPENWFTSDPAAAIHGHGYYTHPGIPVAANECVYRYPNTQEAAPTWFHDHIMGVIRLNVHAGLAGAMPIIDPGLVLPPGLHPVGLEQGAGGPVDFLIPLVIQDHMFDTNGQLMFPNVGINPEHPYWLPEFFGDVICVNGKAWPHLNVEPRRYRFLLINGSNARAYELFLTNPVTQQMGPPIWQIATDGGYLDAPVKIDPLAAKLSRLVILPGERADVIIDFATCAGQNLILRNIAGAPFPKGAPPDGKTVGRIMEFRVGAALVPDLSYNPASGQPLRPPMVRLADPAAGTLAAGVVAQKTRQVTYNEVMGAGGPLEVLFNNTRWSGQRPDGSVTSGSLPITIGGVTTYWSELPNEGEVEVWEIVNMTADAHPWHWHLIQAQIISRQKFNVNTYNKAYAAAFPGSATQLDPMTGLPYPPGVYIPAFGPPLDYATGNPRALGGNPDVTPHLQGAVKLPNANEAGWKDTVVTYPGEVTRVAIRYAPTYVPVGSPEVYPFDPAAGGQGYVFHCHIIDHEDNEMMRAQVVTPKPGAARTIIQGTHY